MWLRHTLRHDMLKRSALRPEHGRCGAGKPTRRSEALLPFWSPMMRSMRTMRNRVLVNENQGQLGRCRVRLHCQIIDQSCISPTAMMWRRDPRSSKRRCTPGSRSRSEKARNPGLVPETTAFARNCPLTAAHGNQLLLLLSEVRENRGWMEGGGGSPKRRLRKPTLSWHVCSHKVVPVGRGPRKQWGAASTLGVAKNRASSASAWWLQQWCIVRRVAPQCRN